MARTRVGPGRSLAALLVAASLASVPLAGVHAAMAGDAAASAARAASNPPTRLVAVQRRPPDRLELRFSAPLADLGPANFRIVEGTVPDIPLVIREVRSADASRVVLVLGGKLDPYATYQVRVLAPPLERETRPSPWGLLVTAILSAALINNFVFTRYLGLCIFFGVSKKRDTALGMAATFGMVMVITAMFSWALFQFVMKPLQLQFLQVLVFIGVVAFLVQALDTILKKTHRALHERFGIYLVLITTNCIILAVPLLNAAADAGPLEAFALALGSGAGFALALFLMSCARERLELARVPPAFQGLPIAFALTGLFALAFMGFSGLSFFK